MPIWECKKKKVRSRKYAAPPAEGLRTPRPSLRKARLRAEAELLKQQTLLRKLEEQRASEEKRRRQQETRQIYDRSLRMKMERTAREMQEQLAFDLQILEQLLEESKNEAMEDAKRKVGEPVGEY